MMMMMIFWILETQTTNKQVSLLFLASVFALPTVCAYFTMSISCLIRYNNWPAIRIFLISPPTIQLAILRGVHAIIPRLPRESMVVEASRAKLAYWGTKVQRKTFFLFVFIRF